MDTLDKIKEFLAYNSYEENIKKIRNDYKAINDFFMEKTLERKDVEYKVRYPIFKNDFLNKINDYILYGDYPEELRDVSFKLAGYTDVKNLVNCYYNLRSVSVFRDKKYKRGIFNFGRPYIGGRYCNSGNSIEYYYDNVLPHEFLHMSSTPLLLSDKYSFQSGFKYGYGTNIMASGFNEGYTEMLSRRIYFDSNYNTTAYRINVYLLLIFELLYDNYRDMEKDYFYANYNSPIHYFTRYGSIEEFFKFLTYLDYFAFTDIKDNEDKEIFDFILNIINRTYDDNKILLAREFEEAYFKSIDKPSEKIFSLSKKRHD